MHNSSNIVDYLQFSGRHKDLLHIMVENRGDNLDYQPSTSSQRKIFKETPKHAKS